MKPTKIFTVVILGLAVFAALSYAEFYNRAPDVLPGTLPEMYTTSFWIGRMENPDEVILTVEEIMARNETYVERMESPDRFEGVDPDRLPQERDLNRWPGRFIVMPDLAAMNSTEVAGIVREEISKDIGLMGGQYLQNVEGLNIRTRKFGNILGIEYAEWEIAELVEEMALDLVPNRVRSRLGITVCDARLRIVPTIKPEQVGLSENGKTRWDIWNVNIVRIASPVQVLHTSKTGAYLFVLSPEGYGWIRSQDIAFGTADLIESYCSSPDFIVCTGDMAPYYSDVNCRYVSGWLRMGDRVKLVSAQTGKKVINVPFRAMNGSFTVEQAWLREDADVSAGYLPYTRRNIVELGFKLLGNPYDWTMGWYGRNHETTSRDMFACFGFELPFNAELFTFFGDNTRVVLPSEGKDAQYQAIMANEPFVTIQTCGGGHNQLYLGAVEGEPYVLDTHGYGYVEDDTEYQIRRLTVGNMNQPDYFLKTPFTFLELK